MKGFIGLDNGELLVKFNIAQDKNIIFLPMGQCTLEQPLFTSSEKKL